MTYDLTALTKWGKEHRRAKSALERSRAELQEEIPAAAAAGVPQAQIVAITGYTRESVRQLCLPPEEREKINERRRKPASK